MNWGAFNERHRLIMLVFFGELAFAAATPDAIALTVCCLFAVLGLFLHYVMAWPAGVTLPFEISRLRMVAHIHVHFFLMVFIPVLGAAFTRMIEEANERSGAEGGEEDAAAAKGCEGAATANRTDTADAEPARGILATDEIHKARVCDSVGADALLRHCRLPPLHRMHCCIAALDARG